MADSARSHEFTLADGRVIAAQDRGPLDGPVVIAHHGTPSCRLDVPGGAAGGGERNGIRVITFDRAGYGLSSNRPGRTVSDVAADVEAIADALGIGRFATIGVSGGGPHALATAVVLGDRVTRVCVSVGLGPVEDPGFDAVACVPAETVAEIRAAQAGPEVLRKFVAQHADPEAGLDPWLTVLPLSDQQVLARPSVRACEEAVARDWQRVSREGWVQDTLAFFVRPWGFDPATVAQPTLLLYGDADVLVPIEHGLALSRLIRGSMLRTVPGGGHWLPEQEAEALAWLADPEETRASPSMLSSVREAQGRTVS
jgi:pimeloyl-ACP methyl ester carboxylesterase